MPEKNGSGGGDFDSFASGYVTLHERNVAISGEEPGYFADYKLDCLERLTGRDFSQPVLDYGCGVGVLTERLARRYSPVHGFDPSAESLRIARERSPNTEFHESENAIPENHFGLAILANVLHHVVPADRNALIARVAGKLVPGSGRLAVFEHNPFNPLTRYAVSRCEFDIDAQLLWPWEVMRLLRQHGFTGMELDFIVFFPRPLALFRPAEPYLGWLPLGAQVIVVGTAAER